MLELLISSRATAVDMSSKMQRNPKPRSSITICEEKSCCLRPNAEATHKCANCKTYQCDACMVELHADGSEYAYHDREKVEVDEWLLCQSRSCPNKNYRDVFCTECQVSYCYDCDTSHHVKAAYANHRRQKVAVCSNGAGGDSKPSVAVIPVSPISTVNPSKGTGSGRDEKAAGISSFLLINGNEDLQFSSAEHFVQTVCTNRQTLVKVASIFGNTGDGKSHTLNHTFFGGAEVFATSQNPSCCTAGVWVACGSSQSVLFIDTEGLLGVTSDNTNRRMRLLLKVLAISDVVIYRTAAGRLHADMFEFLGNASTAFKDYFMPELRVALKKSVSALSASAKSPPTERTVQSLGPALILFHETRHTNLLGSGAGEEPADVVLRRLSGECDLGAFSCVKYVGTKTVGGNATDFQPLFDAVNSELNNTSVRAARSPALVYRALEVLMVDCNWGPVTVPSVLTPILPALNLRFIGDISRPSPNCFPDQYFTCQECCLACNARCRRTMNHEKDGVSHDSHEGCKYVHAYDNKRYLCQTCYARGLTVHVAPQSSASNEGGLLGFANYAISGYVLECKNCGVIYRSRQYWYGNQEPTEQAVRSQTCHVWPGDPCVSSVTSPTGITAWKLLDSVKMVADTVTSVGAKPAKLLGNWAADQVAPSYWVPNSQIQSCHKCKRTFEDTDTKHHCRACGGGFCDLCCTRQRPVPERGWGSDPVRVCDACFESNSCGTEVLNVAEDPETQQVVARKVYENITNKLSAVAVVAADYATGIIKEGARPAYWVPDSEIKQCCVCKALFGPTLSVHHCRSCGQGVCDDCSPRKISVPARGWQHPVRVCSDCYRKSTAS